ncbi:MAG: hypothetical protein Q4D26_11405 [Clostridia bacterium]|nr:hypothetical protein [Clostridia bacterium]
MKKKILSLALFASLLLSTNVAVAADYDYNFNHTIAGNSLPSIDCYIETHAGLQKYEALMFNDQTYLAVNTFRTLNLNYIDNTAVSYNKYSDREEIYVRIVTTADMTYRVSISHYTNSKKWVCIIYRDSSSGGETEIFNREVTVINRNGYNYIPIGIFRDYLGLPVEWKADTKTVTISDSISDMLTSISFDDYVFSWDKNTTPEEFENALIIISEKMNSTDVGILIEEYKKSGAVISDKEEQILREAYTSIVQSSNYYVNNIKNAKAEDKREIFEEFNMDILSKILSTVVF